MIPFPNNVLAEDPEGSFNNKIVHKNKIVVVFYNMGVWSVLTEEYGAEPRHNFLAVLRPFLEKDKRYLSTPISVHEKTFTIPEDILIRLGRDIFYPNVTF